MKILRGLVIIIVCLIAVILIVENLEALFTRVSFRVDLTIINVQYDRIAVYSIMIASFLLGVISMAIYSIANILRLNKEISSIKRAVREKDKELSSLRNMPLTSTSLPGYKENDK